MKNLEYVPLPFLLDNYAWLITDGTHAIVVDPGEAQPVIRYCEARQLGLSGILLTYHHTDHVGGVANLLDWSSNHSVPVFGPATEPIFGVTSRVGDGYRVELTEPDFSATVIAVPGHTDGHIAFFQAAGADNPPHLFSGDTLFASGCGRLLEGTAEHNVGHLYRAKPSLRSFYEVLDPCNCFNAGIGQTSKFYMYRDTSEQ